MECCLIQLILPNQHVSVNPRVCHRESDGRRPETTSHAWSTIYAISRWSQTIADSRLQNAARAKAELAQGGRPRVSAAVPRPLLETSSPNAEIIFRDANQKLFSKHFYLARSLWNAPHTFFFYQISFNIIQLYLTCLKVCCFLKVLRFHQMCGLLISYCLCVKLQH